MLCTRMLLDNKDDKNDNIIAMTVVAIAFPDNLTKHMFNDDNLGMYDVRKIANAVNSSVAAKMKELEIKRGKKFACCCSLLYVRRVEVRY